MVTNSSSKNMKNYLAEYFMIRTFMKMLPIFKKKADKAFNKTYSRRF